MPKIPHDALHHLFREEPLLFNRSMHKVLGFEFPKTRSLSVIDTDLTEVKNIVRQVDTMLLADTVDGEHIVMIEPQTDTSESKRRSWAWYVAYAHNYFGLPVTLMVITPKADTARWARKPVTVGLPEWPTMTLQPIVLGPDNVEPVYDVGAACEDIVYAVLATLTRRLDDDIERPLRVLAAALDTFDGQTARYWAEYTEGGLGEGCARELWRTIMETMPYKYPSQMRLMGREEGRAEGRLEGESRALLKMLEARGVKLSARDRERIATCTDAELLETWVGRAAIAADAEELFAPA